MLYLVVQIIELLGLIGAPSINRCSINGVFFWTLEIEKNITTQVVVKGDGLEWYGVVKKNHHS